jgi:DNA-binding NarL/FixJ family response regulator
VVSAVRRTGTLAAAERPRLHPGRPPATIGEAELRVAEMSLLDDGRACYERRAWGDAYRALVSADRTAPLDPDDLDRLATAAYLYGHDADFDAILERLYRVRCDRGERSHAARAAFWLALMGLIRGEDGRASAWIARGVRLVQDGDGVERGYMSMVVAEQHFRFGRSEAAHAAASEAVTIAEACRDADLLAAARHVQGRALIQQGQVAAGLQHLDEAMLAVVAGELLPIMTALMYCSVIDTCRQVYALGRAREWTAAFSSVCEQQPDLVFNGICLVHRAEILQLRGAWPDAMGEAGRACERARRIGRRPPGAALYQQGEIHRLRGDFDEAEEAYRAASELGFEPQPGLALLRLAQGRGDAACATIRRLTGATRDPLRRAAILPAQLEILLACDELDDARTACDELRALADAFDTDVLRAIAAHAEGAIASAEGRPQAAIEPLRLAFRLWGQLEAPYEAARVRVLIAEACRALNDDDAAALELTAARAAFERLGARPDLARLAAPRRPRPSNGRAPLTARELHVLRLVSTGRTNREIAGELHLSLRTIDRHLTNILTKLDVRTRTAATAYAFDHKLF